MSNPGAGAGCVGFCSVPGLGGAAGRAARGVRCCTRARTPRRGGAGTGSASTAAGAGSAETVLGVASGATGAALAAADTCVSASAGAFTGSAVCATGFVDGARESTSAEVPATTSTARSAIQPRERRLRPGPCDASCTPAPVPEAVTGGACCDRCMMPEPSSKVGLSMTRGIESRVVRAIGGTDAGAMRVSPAARSVLMIRSTCA